MKRIINNQELRLLQIEILDYVHNFCKSNNIKYSLACGTLLGAVRHKGYIPWDDDIDVQLLREDYNKFIQLWTKKNNHPYQLLSLETTQKWVMAYSKICNPNTIMRDGNYNFYGINIDIYPIDSVIDHNDFIERHNKIMLLYDKQSICTRVYKEWWKKILNQIYCFPYTTHNIAKKINNIAKSKNNKENIYIFEMVAGRTYKNFFLKENFNDVVEVEFEGKKYSALKGWNEYLTSCYNNYMQLPPKEKQISHHNTEAYWK